MTTYTGTPTDWANTFKMMLKTGTSLEDLNAANHKGLETKVITIDHFKAAAEVLKNEFQKR